MTIFSFRDAVIMPLRLFYAAALTHHACRDCDQLGECSWLALSEAVKRPELLLAHMSVVAWATSTTMQPAGTGRPGGVGTPLFYFADKTSESEEQDGNRKLVVVMLTGGTFGYAYILRNGAQSTANCGITQPKLNAP